MRRRAGALSHWLGGLGLTAMAFRPRAPRWINGSGLQALRASCDVSPAGSLSARLCNPLQPATRCTLCVHLPSQPGEPPFDLMFFVSPEWNTTIVQAIMEWVSAVVNTAAEETRSSCRYGMAGRCTEYCSGAVQCWRSCSGRPPNPKPCHGYTPNPSPYLPRCPCQGRPAHVVVMLHNGDSPSLHQLMAMHPRVRVVTLSPHVAK